MSNNLTHILIALILWSINLTGYAQSCESFPRYQFTNYSVDDGLSHNFIMSVYQDEEGFMWFGTLNGLDRFDGKSFKHFDRNDNDTTAIIGDFVNFIYKDSYGKTWIGTENGGLHLFDKKMERFKLIYDKDSIHQKKRFFANSITEDKQGNLWIGTFSGLKLYNRFSQSYITYQHLAGDTSSLCNNNVLKVYCDINNQIWVGTKNGLDILSADRKTFKHINLLGKRATDSEVIEFMEDKNDIMWIGTFSNGLIKYNTKKNTYKVIRLNPDDDYSNTVRRMVKDDLGRIWIGGRNGVFIYDPEKENYIHIAHEESYPLGIPHNSILDMFKDKSGNIWLGTRYGVSQWNKQKQTFKYYCSEKQNNRGMNSSSVFNFQEVDDKIFIATESGGVNILNADDTFSYLTIPLLNTNNIKCICRADNGDLWFGTFMGGIDVYSPDKKTVRYYLKNQNQNTDKTICDDRVNAIVRDFKNDLWIGTGSGLALYNKTKDNFDHFTNFTTRQINWIKEMDKTLWFATADSLFQLQLETDSLLLAKNMDVVTRTIFKDQSNQFWITTVGKGLIKYSGNNDIQYITTKDGLSSNLTFGILEDKYGNLWISSSNGLNKFNPTTKEIETYYKNDGTQINQFNYNSFTKLHSGEFMFGGNNGFVRFNPDEMPGYVVNNRIKITNFSLFDKPLTLNDSSSILKKSIIYTDTITLDYTQNFFTINFSLLNFTNYARNNYKYKLSGVNKHWINAGNLNHATYTNISPGEYLFKVKGTNNNLWCDEEECQLYIIINPPFYRTTIFVLICAISCIVLFFLILRWRNITNIRKSKQLQRLINEKTLHLQNNKVEILNQKKEIELQNEQLLNLSEQVQSKNRELEQQAARLEKMVQLRTSELENAKVRAEESDRLKSVFLANMSHEIRTPMNGILGFTDLLKDPEIKKQEQIDFVNIIEESGKRMLNIINDLIDISKIESNQIDLHMEKIIPDDILEYMYQFYKPDVNKKNLIFTKNTFLNNETIEYKTDKTKLIQILSNLLNNSIKFTSHGFIEIGYKINQNYIEWFVSDSGIGIPSSLYNKIFERFMQGDSSITKKYEGAGLGLYICKQFVEKMHGKLTLYSEVNKGTTFKVQFPLL